MPREKKATAFKDLSPTLQSNFLADTLFNDAGISEELDRRWWGAGQGENNWQNQPICVFTNRPS